jgi:molybdate transport system ATP-binding protein
MIHAAVQLARDGFSLDVDLRTTSHITGVFGASGAGKTTLLHAIAGLTRPDGGRITIGDQPVFDSARNLHVPPHRRNIAVVFQEARLFPHYRVRSNMLYSPRGRTGNPADFDQLTDLLELRPLLNRRTAGLSGGEQQRVALARALLSRPRALLLDEPLSSLDVRLKQTALRGLAQAITQAPMPVLYVSHDLGEILRLTDQVAVLDAGRLVGIGSYTDLVHDAKVWSVVRERGASNIITAHLVRHDPEEKVSIVQLPGPAGSRQELVIPAVAATPGSSVSISIPPWDIALAAAPVTAVSIQNQLRGTVKRLSMHDRGVLVEIDVGSMLLAEVSRRAATTMGLREGSPVVCLIKTQSIGRQDST